MRMIFYNKPNNIPAKSESDQQDEVFYRYDYNRDIFIPVSQAVRNKSEKGQIGYTAAMQESDDTDYVEEGEKFLHMLQEEFQEMPETWKQYDKTSAGRQAIVDMEYKEFKQALTTKKMPKITKELMHLIGACFYLYKGLEDE